MWFEKPFIVYVSRTSLRLYNAKEGEISSFEFPQGSVANLEIVNEELFQKSFGDFLANLDLKNRKAVLVLTKSIYFEKLLPEGSPEEDGLKFFNSIPFENFMVLQKTFDTDSGTLLFAANKFFYGKIAEIFESFGWKIKAIWPVTLFFTPKSKDDLSADEVGEIFNSWQKLKKEDLRNNQGQAFAEKQQGVVLENSRNAYGIKTIFLSVTLILVLVSSLFLFRMWLPSNKPLAPALEKQQGKEEESKKVTTNNPIASESGVFFEKVTIRIDNGTGILGQASKTKDLLQKSGFKNIEVGTTKLQSTAQTSVVFAPDIVQAVRDRIIQVLDEYFVNIDVSEDPILPAGQVVIVTGEQKKDF